MKASANKYPDNKGRYSVIAHGPDKPLMVVIGSDCNGGNVELTIKYLQGLGYTSIVIIER